MSNISQFMGGGVKSVQSGVASGAGTVTITSVNTTKSVVHSISKGSAGTVAARGTLTPSGTSSLSGNLGSFTIGDQNGFLGSYGHNIAISGTITEAASTLSGGTTDLTTKQYSARLTNANTLTVDGPCEWQVVEYY